MQVSLKSKFASNKEQQLHMIQNWLLNNLFPHTKKKCTFDNLTRKRLRIELKTFQIKNQRQVDN